MVTALLHPLNIFILGFGGGFLIPVLNKVGKSWVSFVLVFVLATMVAISGSALISFLHGAPEIEILTGGNTPPYSINLRLGLEESVFSLSVGLIALLGSIYVVREKYAVMLIYLLIVTGIQGMIMTRDLFNLFVFVEIVSIATYGLLTLGETPAALSASFKYIMATVFASTFLLLGTILLYASSGFLNIDDLLAHRELIVGPLGFAGLMFVLACLLIELKPFPANGWALDVYETAPSAVAALLSVAVSAGVFFALFKLLPLFEDHLTVIALSGGVTFLFSNLIGLTQNKAQRLLGYSSIGQMGLLVMALALLYRPGDEKMPLVVIGLFVNHLFAKAGLFWFAGYIGKERLEDFAILAKRPLLLVVFCVLLAAIAGFPPFPGFWAKWHLVFTLAARDQYAWIAVILAGSLFEAAYLFRWFGRIVHSSSESEQFPNSRAETLVPPFAAALLLIACGFYGANLAGIASLWVLAPLAGGFVLYLLDSLPGQMKSTLLSVILLVGGLWLIHDLDGLNFLFAALFYSGSVVLSIACFYRSDRRPGFHALLAVLLLSLSALPRSSTSLEFFFIWELITLSSYFLILRGRAAESDALRYLLFSLVAAFFLLVGFATATAGNGSIDLAALRTSSPNSTLAFLLFAIGFLIKSGAIGVHVWLAGAYAEADDDVSAILSALVSKVSIFGLLVGTYLAIRSQIGLDLSHAVGAIGILTTFVGAMLAIRQDDIKRMLAYSSMSQLGYIVTAIALTSHLGWVTAFYLTANHMMVKGILFLAAAALILRTGTRSITNLGGLARSMPLTFGLSAFAIVAMSGLPPLAGFGGKWLLLSAMMDKEWYGLVVIGVLATFAGFLYMWHFLQAVFLSAPAATHGRITEAPSALLIPQFLLAAGIIVMSFYPKLLIEPLSRAIDPYFASTLIWNGMSLELIYAYWNPIPVMAFAVAASALLFGVFWLLRNIRRRSTSNGRAKTDGAPANDSVYDYCQSVCTALTPPCAYAFWDSVASAVLFIGGRLRLLYTGDGQTYNLYILYYFIVLYIACGGASHIWMGS